MRNCIYKLSKFKCNMKTGLELNWVCRSQSAKEYVVFLNRQKDKDFALVSNLFSFWQLTSIFSEYKTNAIKKWLLIMQEQVACLPFQVKVREKNCCFIRYQTAPYKGTFKEENQRCREIRRLVSLKKNKVWLDISQHWFEKKKKIKQTHLKQVWQKANGYE